MRFAGKVAIVTGAASGIGKATATLLAGEGALVTVADINRDGATQTALAIEAAGGTARAQDVDVADPASVEAMVADTVAAFGGLDVLHNNAAAIELNLGDQDIVTMELATWDRALAVNLTGAMLGCRFAIPRMIERGGGSIVNTASAAAFYGGASMAYGVSKAGMVSLTQSIATMYGDRGIRCNAVAPGVVLAKHIQDALGGPMSDRLKKYTTSHVIGRLGYPDEIARAVAFLASDDASFVTGETLRIDGGYTAHYPQYAVDRLERQ